MSIATTALIDLQPIPTEITGIWDDQESVIYTRYRVTLAFTGRVLGGIPQKPEIIESWLRQRVTGGDEEVRQLMLKTLDDLGHDVSEGMTMEQLHAVAKDVAAKQHGNTFRRDSNGMYLSNYQLKAAMRENVNILFAGERWGATKKGPKSFVNERVFVDEGRLYLTRGGLPITEPDGKHLQIGHVTGPQGPRSTLTYYDYIDQPTTTFDVLSLRDGVTQTQWRDIFLSMQRNGIGALRSQSYGTFKITGWEYVSGFQAK